MALQKFSKSQKMLYWVVKVLFSSQKTATKCVALQKYSKSQKMYRMHCYTQQQGKLVTSQSELVFCQLAFLAEASKNSIKYSRTLKAEFKAKPKLQMARAWCA